MGGKASQQWGVTTRVARYGIVLSAPQPAPNTEVAEVVQAEVAEVEPEPEQWTQHTITDVDGSLGWRSVAGPVRGACRGAQAQTMIN
jgi:hypothetical protein